MRKIGALLIELGSLASRAINVIFYGGTADVTLSARAYAQPLPRTRWLIDFVFALFGDPDHCRRWYEHDLTRSQHLLDLTPTWTRTDEEVRVLQALPREQRDLHEQPEAVAGHGP